MPRFFADEIENYGGNGGGGFFSLKNDGDVARVRFMYNDIEDVAGYAVHEVEVDGRKRYVNCLREYNQPVDNCPFCKHQRVQQVKLYIPIYDVDEKKVKVWERGKKFFNKLSSVCARFGTNEPLVSHVFEIERHGKPGDRETTYEIYEAGKDNTTLEDLPELPVILGGLVLDKSEKELDFYLANGYFADSVEDLPVRKREPLNTVESNSEINSTSMIRRRTPIRDTNGF